MLKTVKTLFTINEMKTDGHAPVLFHCSDGHNYYCKYRIVPNPREINCLAFEIVATCLLQHLQIPTPDIAMVEIQPDTLDQNRIRQNKRMRPGMVIFGSKEIRFSRLVDEFSILNDKNDFNKLLNPEDIVKIALFDLWVKNGDRGRKISGGFNYNLLLEADNNKAKIIAFDHAFIFGGSLNIGNFFPNTTCDNADYLHQTTFYSSIIRYMDKSKYKAVIDNFVSLQRNDTTEIIQNVFNQLPESWDLLEGLEERVINLLSAPQRIESFAETLLNAKS